MNKKKVLVIEDDPDVRLGYRVLLKAHNYETFFAADGLSAITETRKHDPDLIILDLGLPAGDGFVVLERLRMNTNFALIPVIVVSARDQATNKARARKAGAQAYLQKPWNDVELLALVSELVSGSAIA